MLHTVTARPAAGRGRVVPAGTLARIERMFEETGEVVSFKVGEEVEFRAPGKSCVVIVSSGAAGLIHVLKDGRRTISNLFLPGDVFDPRYMVPRDGKLVCLSPVNAFRIETDDLDELQEQNTDVRDVLMANYFDRLSVATRHCVDLACKSAIEKLVSFLLECHARQKDKNGRRVCLMMKRVDIADYLGLRPETLSRSFAKLKDMGLIAHNSDDVIQLVDEPCLRQIANGAPIPAELNS